MGSTTRIAPYHPEHADGDAANLTSRTLSGFKWAFLSAGGQALLSLAVVMILARLLTPQDFGQLAVALIFITLADTVVRRGLGQALIQRFELTQRHIATGLTLSLAAGVLLAAALWGLAPWFARLIGEPEAAPILRTLSFATVLTGAGVVSEHRLHRDLRFRPLMTAAIGSQAIGNGLVAILLALMDHGVWALVWGTLARTAVFSLAVIAFAPPPRGLGAGRREAAELLHTGTGFTALALFNVLSTQGLNLVIARTLGATPFGLYTLALALAMVPTRISSVLSSVLRPAMALRQRRTDRLSTVHLNGIEVLSLATLPASLMIAVSAPEIVAVVLGEQWDGAVPALRILALVGALQSFNALHVPVIQALGAVYRETWRRALFFVLLLGGAWFASRWGLLGVVIAVGAVRFVLHALLVHLVLGLLGMHWITLLRRHVPALWAGLWATTVLWLAADTIRGADWSSAAALALQLTAWAATAGAAVYFAPPFARPSFPHWGLARLPFADMGRAGRWARVALEHLARRWPAPHGASTP